MLKWENAENDNCWPLCNSKTNVDSDQQHDSCCNLTTNTIFSLVLHLPSPDLNTNLHNLYQLVWIKRLSLYWLCWFVFSFLNSFVINLASTIELFSLTCASTYNLQPSRFLMRIIITFEILSFEINGLFHKRNIMIDIFCLSERQLLHYQSILSSHL